jgi:hypothetical protein
VVKARSRFTTAGASITALIDDDLLVSSTMTGL